MTARSFEVGEVLAKELKRFLADLVPNVSSEFVLVPRVDDATFDEWIDNQKSLGVFVAPLRKAGKVESRGSDQVQYGFGIFFVEKCVDATEESIPSVDWVRKRVAVLEAAENHFGDLRKPWTAEDQSKLRAVESEISLVYDPEVLRENHAFFAFWELTLSERVFA